MVVLALPSFTTTVEGNSLSKHGPDSECKHCARVREYAEKYIDEPFHECRVCQGWGWTIGCPGCGRIWGKIKPQGKG